MGATSGVQLLSRRFVLSRANLAAKGERRAAYSKLRSLCGSAFAKPVEVALNPLGFEIAQCPDSQVDSQNPRHTLGLGVSEDDSEYAPGYRKFMHVAFRMKRNQLLNKDLRNALFQSGERRGGSLAPRASAGI